MAKFWKWVKYLGGAIIALALGSYLIFQVYYWVMNRKAKVKLDKKVTLVENGHQYRDLNQNGKLDIYEDSRQNTEARIDDLISQMSLVDKVGMLWHPPIGVGRKGKVLGKPSFINPTSSYVAIVNQKIRHFNLFTVPRTKSLATWYNRIQKIAEKDDLGIPITISSDPRHGVHNFLDDELLGGDFSRWPEPIGLAALGDSAYMEEFARIARDEYLAVGIRTALHPMADLATEPRWARINGTFGEDARLSAKMTAAYIRGFQGERLGAGSVACMTKHWPGGGPQRDGQDPHFSYGKEQGYPGNNFEYHLIPFLAALEAGTAMVMPYYGIPIDQTSENVGMAFNSEIITDLLRNQYGYQGVVCSDWGILEGFSFAGLEIIEAKHWGVENLSLEQKIIKALKAGIDQFGGNSNTKALLELVKGGVISEARLDQSVRRLLKVKFDLGLFDDPYVDVDRAVSTVGKESYRKAGAEAQRRSMVLLKNTKDSSDKPILPLKRDLTIYVENINPEVAIQYGRLVETPEMADVAIIRLSAPYEDRDDQFAERYFHQGSLDFPQGEITRLQALMGKVPVVLSIYLDRPAIFSELNQSAAAVVAEFGSYDDAVMDVIFGVYQPQGRLPFEIPSSMEAVAAQKEDLPYDSQDPLYTFGFGLNYE